ncbi:UNVERIFIED_CONTAM: hypothetical protein K2H54_058089 [Gekko kuhli]
MGRPRDGGKGRRGKCFRVPRSVVRRELVKVKDKHGYCTIYYVNKKKYLLETKDERPANTHWFSARNSIG